MLSLRSTALYALLAGALVLGALKWRDLSSLNQPVISAAPVIQKQPVQFASRTFDPSQPPADMPPLPPGEEAQCESNFVSNAVVGGQVRRIDPTHGSLLITKVNVTLGLDITIWTPPGASEHVMEHEQGHRQISESYYRNADEVASRIASVYMGRQIDVTGTDLNAEANKVLQQTATEITEEYKKELDPEAAQLLFDDITDHARNDVPASDAVNHALKNVSVESSADGKS